ncbi:DNA primase [Phorcysia thermohydrogeniphila]|uniref:DNA primase n=1 Tax=Phorcysia thermohydrogeniphila TaxID=936138 RepID=A0A4R1GJX5_9BACT|nr:DNA primase [Phorcysia thermohydrogeniphila]TCK06289.1 DNA primase [Phorcysia thermohydrogeniphila]
MGRKIPHSFIQELLSRVDIVDIVSHYLSLKQVGRNFTALCPFHPEKTPSFVVSPEKQIFKCFGCGIGGNAITFVEKYENLSFVEAVKRVAELAGIEIPTSFTEDDKVAVIEEAGFKAAKYFHSQLSQVSQYIEQRGISPKEAERFLIGFAPRGYSRKLNIKAEIAKELGLINERGKEFFAERLIIPIFSHSGKVIAFAGRTLKSDSSLPKYVNSPESSIFKKNSTLYGFYQSRETILKEKKAIIVEGYFDVISLHQIGVKNAVAPMGTSLTENHAKIIKRYTESPILMFDGDSAGRKATIRSAGLFLQRGVEPLVVQLPESEDPDSMAKENPSELRKLILSPLTFIDWSIQTVKLLSDQEKPAVLREIAQAIAPLKALNPFIYKRYVSKLSAEFGIDEHWIRLNTGALSRLREETAENPVPPHEKAFLRALLEKRFQLPLEVSPNIFVSDEVSRVYSIIRNTEFQDPTVLQTEFPELSGFISEVLFSDFSEEEMKMAVCRVLCKELERRLKKLHDLKEKKELKNLIFSLRRGNLNALACALSRTTN